MQRLLLQAGRDDKRVTALLALAHNQGVSVVRESRAGLDKIVSARHQGAVAQLRDGAAQDDAAASNLWREADLLHAVENKGGPVLTTDRDGHRPRMRLRPSSGGT